MKQRVISAGNGAAQPSLSGALRFSLRKMALLFEQIIRVCHIRSTPHLFFAFSLFGLAAKIEVGLQSKLLRLNLTQDQVRNAPSHGAQEGRLVAESFSTTRKNTATSPLQSSAKLYRIRTTSEASSAEAFSTPLAICFCCTNPQ